MKRERTIVVGAGLGGLSAAANLCKSGLQVDVFDPNPHPGGYACSFVRGGYEFEASLHELSGIGPPDNRGGCYQMLERCDVAKRLEFLPIDHFYTSIFPDFTITIPHGWEEAEEAYASQFPDQRKGIANIMKTMHQMYRGVAMLAKARGPADLLTFPLKGMDLIRSFGVTAAQVLDREFSDEKLKALFCDIWGYYGLPPSRLSWQLLAMGNASYIDHGPYHVKGTSQALSNAFVESIEENGGHVHLRNGIKKITVDGNRVSGVVTDRGDEIKADYIVCNANPVTACYNLIGREHVPAAYLRALASGHIAMSTYNVYMGLDCPAEELGITGHEYFMNDSYDQDAHYRAMFTRDRQPYYVLTNYNSADPGFSPPGTSVMVITCLCDHAAWDRVPPERYASEKERLASELIAATDRHFPGLAGHVAVAEVSTPVTNMRYSGNPGGTILGFDYDVAGSPFMRLPNRGPLERLYFAGAWVRPGGGFETCIQSGVFACGEVMKDVKGVKGIARAIPAM